MKIGYPAWLGSDGLRAIIIANKLSLMFNDEGASWYVFAVDGGVTHETRIFKDNGADQTDFETNYQSTGNKKIDQRDADGSFLQRTKITTTGWHFQLHGIEFTISKIGSINSKKADGTNWGFTTMKFYKLVESVETEITGDDLNQTFLDSNCIKTIVDWEPTFDIDIIGGMLKQAAPPSEHVELWIIGAPDVSEAYGGSKLFASNLCIGDLGEGIAIDGKTPKFVPYNATYHSGKFRLIFRHPAGFQHTMHMIFELFKA